MLQVAHFSAIATKQKVDADSGIIHGVSVVTTGDAQGHGLKIDKTLLSQVVDCAKTYAGGVKVRFNHPSSESEAKVEATAGILRDFSIDGEHVRANLHLLKSDRYFSKIIEMAEKMPEAFGLSLSFSGVHEKVGSDKFARCSEIYAVDLVDAPAANPTGLFSAKQTPKAITMTLDTVKLAKALGLTDTATEAEVESAMLARLSAKPEPVDFSAINQKIEAAQTKLAEYEKKAEQAVALSKKDKIDVLLAEASSAKKVVPLDVDDLYTVKDGVVSIHTEPAQLAKIIAKLTPAIQFKRHEIKPLVNKENKPLSESEKVEFAAARKAEGAVALNELFASMNRN